MAKVTYMSEFSDEQERRQHVRKEVSFQIEIKHISTGLCEQVELLDISSGGMRFKVSDITQYSLKKELHAHIPQFIGGEVSMQHVYAIVLSVNKTAETSTSATIGASLRQIS